MSDIVIKAENLGKKYTIGHQAANGRYVALRDVLVQNARNFWRTTKDLLRGKPIILGNELEEVWALKDVSFEIRRGEAVGIIGRNGAGKSTLLKVLSRITEPSAGRVTIKGRVSSLLEVGTGFHPELTGRENIYLNGAILGMTRAEVKRKFDEIVAFAEIEKFLDTPVKRYSSGMYVRLAFAVAAHLEPEILLVDEVLAVGDATFQRKCLGKMGDVAHQGRTVFFVSHNMGAVRRLCSRALWLDEGELLMTGSPEKAISEYLLTGASRSGECVWEEGVAKNGVEELEVYSVRLLDRQGRTTSRVSVSQPFYVEVEFQIKKRLPYCRVGFILGKYDGTIVFVTYDSDDEALQGRRMPGYYEVRCEIPANLLNTGEYTISLNAGIPNLKKLISADGVLTFTVEQTGAVGSRLCKERRGVIRPKLEWERKR